MPLTQNVERFNTDKALTGKQSRGMILLPCTIHAGSPRRLLNAGMRRPIITIQHTKHVTFNIGKRCDECRYSRRMSSYHSSLNQAWHDTHNSSTSMVLDSGDGSVALPVDTTRTTRPRTLKNGVK